MSVAFLSALLLQTAQATPGVEPLRVVRRPARERTCREQEGEDIVVCGQRYDENSRFRMPQQFRNQRSDDDRHASWEARWRDEQILGSFSGQTLGPSGYLQGMRERDCEWRTGRQVAQGRRPDCGRRHRPDDVSDWQRR